ncbi:unnamed protein product [marine sediment metagenome]|uniref:Uncharacterized protein n=1 Tax=marine sediment metagenome TaxID=412755 RepID=X1A7T2_9ZZZZ
MKNEKYKEAVILLEKLREIEKKNEDFEYSLSHKLYQLISNSNSLYNQEIILEHIKKMSNKQNFLTIHELHLSLKEKDFTIEESVLGKEIELLILRDLLPCKKEGDKIIF